MEANTNHTNDTNKIDNTKNMKTILKILNNDWFWSILAGLVFAFAIAHWCDAKAQRVTRQGNVFVQDSTSHRFAKQNVTLTKYFYLASDGTKYPIYMSANGKCFIWRTSAKTGKQYKQYLPEIDPLKISGSLGDMNLNHLHLSWTERGLLLI